MTSYQSIIKSAPCNKIGHIACNEPWYKILHIIEKLTYNIVFEKTYIENLRKIQTIGEITKAAINDYAYEPPVNIIREIETNTHNIME
jgi:hypothetical protein